ncbi:MAG TPA: ATP-binding protein [Candidatus Angelobacter sp.]|nr:ATP-binding protein [Candidatus Angelobacter sp.]
MPFLHLRTKLVLAITAMVVAIVVTLLGLYISEVVDQRIQEASQDADFVAHEIFSIAREALEVDLTDTKVNMDDPKQVEAAVEEALQRDSGVYSLLESVVGYSPSVYDAAITNTDGRALLHTNEALVGKVLPRREAFSAIMHGGSRKQIEAIYGPIRQYDVVVPLRRDGIPFGEVRVGVSTAFLKNILPFGNPAQTTRPLLSRALIVSGITILICMVLAAGLSNFALRPLEAISRRLDLITAGQIEAPETPERSDEYGAVSTKIERLGRQMRDVKEVFSALKENLDQMMANLQDGVMLFTSDFRAVLVSASAEQFIGKPRGQMLGCHPTEIFEENTFLGHTILRAFENRRALVQEEIAAEGGHHIQISLDFIEEDDERIGALLTLRDAESVHRIEDEIELSRRLAAIGRLTSGVAHEVKNPINAIVVHLEVLRQKLNAVDPATRRHLDVIGTEIRRLDRVVQTLVDFTRPVELRLADLDLRKLVDDVVQLASPDAEMHSVHIERHLSTEPLPTRIDSDLVKQALLNIVLNGVQAMPQGGNLNVATRREGESAVVLVHDEGQGIAPEIQDKIFNLYFTTKKEGSGIGLAMTYRVVQLHNGSVEFDSSEGQGTTFYLRLPMSENSSVGDSLIAPSENSLRTT